MKQLRNYISIHKGQSEIKATNETLSKIVMSEIERLGKEADLNHIDVSKCTDFSGLFNNVNDINFQGDVSKWDMSNAENTMYMFTECDKFNCDLSEWSLNSLRKASHMFANCASLTKAPELPVTTLTPQCYRFMFMGCTSLETAPELPATILTERCYWDMFWGCTSLVDAPELPATTLAQYCYGYMFYGCTLLKEMPKIAAKDWNNKNYSINMFTGTKFENYGK